MLIPRSGVGVDRAFFAVYSGTNGGLGTLDDPSALSRVGPAPLARGGGAPVRTFLIADIRGYTQYTHDHGDEAAAALAGQFARLARATAESHGGEVIELRGDEALAVFDSPRAAMRAAVDLQEHCRRHTDSDPAHPLHVGIGIDSGEATQVEDGYRGNALNVASRLCALAGPEQTLATEGVVHLARHVAGLEQADRGAVALRGVAEPVRVYEIAADGQLPAVLDPLQPPAAVSKEQSELLQAGMITGFVGSGFGVLALLLDLGFHLFPFAEPVSLVGAIASCAAALVGADAMPRRPGRGAVLAGAAAVGLLVFASWASVMALILLVISAGMGYFGGKSSS